MAKFRVVGINFDHMHMGDNLRMVHEHPDAEIVGLCDETPVRMESASNSFGIASDQLFTDVEACMEASWPDLVILCPAAARHAEWVKRVAPFGVDMMLEKPMAGSLAEADEMVAAVSSEQRLAINWPLVWVASHQYAKKLIDAGEIGDITSINYYDGNRGPLYHLADKVETTPEWIAAEKPNSWFYKKAHGGGSLLDYLGYGTTLGTWFYNGEMPIEVTTTVDSPVGLEVDEHSITVARYARGLSKFETRWGTFTDPWTHQPQPKCGFAIVGSKGTISSYDYEPTITVQTEAHPEPRALDVKPLIAPFQNPIQYMLHIKEQGEPVTGPLSPEHSRKGQQIVDTAMASAEQKRALPLIK